MCYFLLRLKSSEAFSSQNIPPLFQSPGASEGSLGTKKVILWVPIDHQVYKVYIIIAMTPGMY